MVRVLPPRAAAVIGVLLGIATLAKADVPLNRYLLDKKQADAFSQQSNYLFAVGNGLKQANLSNEKQGLPRIYCAPDNVTLDVKDYPKIVDDEVARMAKAGATMKRLGNLSVEFVLMEGMRHAFPCKS